MTWYKVEISREKVILGELDRLTSKLVDKCQSSPLPPTAAIFSDPDIKTGIEHLYFSPAITSFASDLISAYSGVACNKPVSSELVLFFGKESAWDLIS